MRQSLDMHSALTVVGALSTFNYGNLAIRYVSQYRANEALSWEILQYCLYLTVEEVALKKG